MQTQHQKEKGEKKVVEFSLPEHMLKLAMSELENLSSFQ